MTDVMVDLETWGKEPGCAIRSVGAAVFDRLTDAPVVDTFYRNVDTWSCLDVRLHVDRGTRDWWARQSDEARAKLKEDPLPLADVVQAFHAWVFRVAGRDATVWGQGAGFDPPIWEHAARAVGQPPPWKFWNVRDTRTVYDLAGFDPKSLVREGTYHGALDDALHQVRCVRAAVSLLSRRTPT